MITAEVAKTNTRQVIEDIIEGAIYDASKCGAYSITVSREKLPEWLSTKLKDLGYTIQDVTSEPDSTPLYKILWGC